MCSSDLVWLYADPNHEKGEFAVMVRSDRKGRGVGWILMRRMIEWARADQLEAIEGYVLAENAAMLKMARELGFVETDAPESRSVRVLRLKLG